MCVINKISKKIKHPNIIISNSVKEIFEKYKQIGHNALEACGILIGNHRKDGETLFIKHATIPQERDIRKRNSFIIVSNKHQSILDQYFKKSLNEDVYLGTWHTHPENNPTPSTLDISDWNKQFKTNINLFSRMVFAIIGIKSINYWINEESGLIKLPRSNVYYENT